MEVVTVCSMCLHLIGPPPTTIVHSSHVNRFSCGSVCANRLCLLVTLSVRMLATCSTILWWQMNGMSVFVPVHLQVVCSEWWMRDSVHWVEMCTPSGMCTTIVGFVSFNLLHCDYVCLCTQSFGMLWRIVCIIL